MQGDAICIIKAGVTSCMNTGFPNTHYVGDNISDNRACGPDPCNNTKVSLNKGTCATPAFTFYADDKCMNNIFSAQTADNMCRNIAQGGNTLTVASCKYTSSSNNNASCSYTGSYAATGTATPSNVQTICCL
jgi:hypothetical protein